MNRDNILIAFGVSVGIIILILFATMFLIYTRLSDVENSFQNQINNLSVKVQNENENMNQSIDTLSNNITSLDIRYKQLNLSLLKTQNDLSQLNNETSVLKSEFKEFKKQYVDLSAAYNEKSKEYDTLKQDMLSLDSKIKQKMIWFTDNNQLTSSEIHELRGPMEDINDKCIEGNGVNLPCVSAFLNKDGYTYISDKKDHIDSIDEFINNGGGDCEDWTLFVKAFLNMHKDKRLILSKQDEGSKFNLYTEGNTIWYLRDMKDISFSTSDKTYLGVCYSTETVGHCVLSLSNNAFIQNRDVVFEPQNGRYLGEIVEEDMPDSQFYIDENNYLYPVIVVIGSKDIYVWDSGTRGWLSYEGLNRRINGLLN